MLNLMYYSGVGDSTAGAGHDMHPDPPKYRHGALGIDLECEFYFQSGIKTRLVFNASRIRPKSVTHALLWSIAQFGMTGAYKE